MHLIEERDISSFSEVFAGRRLSLVSDLALHGKLSLAIFENDEIDLSFVCVPNKAQLHVIALCVFNVVTIFIQLACHHVLEPASWILDSGPIPEIQLVLLLYGSYSFAPEWGDSEAHIESFQNADPVLYSWLSSLDESGYTVDGKRGSYA